MEKTDEWFAPRESALTDEMNVKRAHLESAT